MATMGIVAPTTGRVKISDEYLEANYDNPEAVIDIHDLTPQEAFEYGGSNSRARGTGGFVVGSGILIDGARGEQGGGPDFTAAQAIVNGCERDENMAMPLTESYNCRVLYPCRFRYIYPNLTTARGIKIHSAG